MSKSFTCTILNTQIPKNLVNNKYENNKRKVMFCKMALARGFTYFTNSRNAKRS